MRFGENIKLIIFNCKIIISFYFIAFVALFLIIGKIYLLSVVLFSIVHELGHVFAMAVFNKRINEIKINAFSIDIIKNFDNIPMFQEIFVLISGPVFNLICCAVFYILYLLFKIIHFKIFGVQNLIMGLLNLLPIYSLDGGQILFLILKNRFSIFVSDMILFILSLMFIIPLVVLGFWLFIQSHFNISLLILIAYLIYSFLSGVN